ncbi:uncharacterized protein OCT59_011990 [Rhizophagus irregularis]|uniref:uncharacterized protein n=1 Tax=Rhizophagus irregularis TaxID=588596 RepID=UPI003318EEDC|nr:hypothetical protein OCT59_011990 [Rhizophagus irregularis]
MKIPEKLYLHNQVKAFDNFNEHSTELGEIDIKKSGIIPEYDKPSNDKNVNCEAYENNIDIQLELKCLKELKEVQVLINKLDFKDSFTAEEFVLYDDFEVTTEMISDDEILKAV